MHKYHNNSGDETENSQQSLILMIYLILQLFSYSEHVPDKNRLILLKTKNRSITY